MTVEQGGAASPFFAPPSRTATTSSGGPSYTFGGSPSGNSSGFGQLTQSATTTTKSGGSGFGQLVPQTKPNNNGGSAFGQATQTKSNNSSSSFGRMATPIGGGSFVTPSNQNGFAWGQPQETRREPVLQPTGEASRQRSIVIEQKLDQLLTWKDDCTKALQWLIDQQKASATPPCQSREDTRGHDYVEQIDQMQCMRCGKRVGIMPVSF